MFFALYRRMSNLPPNPLNNLDNKGTLKGILGKKSHIDNKGTRL